MIQPTITFTEIDWCEDAGVVAGITHVIHEKTVEDYHRANKKLPSIRVWC